MPRLLILTLLMLLAGASGASAATVSMSETPEDRYASGSASVVFAAQPGEANRVLAVPDRQSWVVRDDGAPLAAGGGCVALDGFSVRCTSSRYVPGLAIDTGDGDDSVRVPDGTYLTIRLGDGNDFVHADGNLMGGPGDDVLEGGPEKDSMLGGAGADILRGGAGDDSLSGDSGMPGTGDDTPFDDVLDGGPGVDGATYAQRRTAVFADLAHGVAGSGTERDTLTAIESVSTGSGNDVLLGDDNANELDGGAGDDQIAGAGGNDILTDGNGVDNLDGGTGNDRLAAANAGDHLTGGVGGDILSGGTGAILDAGEGDDMLVLLGTRFFPQQVALAGCGPGTDTVHGQYLTGQRLDGCELLAVDGQVRGLLTLPTAPARRGTDRLALPLACTLPGATGVACVGRLTVALMRPGRATLRLGHADFRLRSRRHTTAVVRLTTAGRRALRGAGPHPLLELFVGIQGMEHAPAPYVILQPTQARWQIGL